ncbi:MAG TPA: hypothetical protein VFR27_11330 [Mycobacterium sp.]|nr:hypothetical protein [Mycobacterium sp.]
MRVGALLAGPTLVGAAVLGTAPDRPVGSPGYGQRDIALAAAGFPAVTDTTAAGLGILDAPKFLLDNVFHIGEKSLSQLIVNPLTNTSPSFGGLLGWLGLSTNDQFSMVFDHLGFQYLTVGGILNSVGFPDTETVAQAAQHLNQLLGGLGLVSESTVAELLHGLDPSIATSGAGDLTLAQVLTDININPTEPLNEILDNLFIGPGATLGDETVAQLLDLLLKPGETAVPNPPGVEDATLLTDYLTGIGLGSNLTIDQLLGLDPSGIVG